jgi:hypothetical protein
MKSGSNMGLVVQELRQLMFNQWMVAPTSKNSKVQYCPITMTDRYKDWAPPWWTSWKALGPPAGSDCSPVFMSECCGFTAIVNEDDILPCVALDRHFQMQVSNFKGLSREKAAKFRKDELKKERDASELSSLPTVSRSSPSQSQLIINLEIRKERRLVRSQEIERLTWLIARAKERQDAVKQDQWQLQLDLLYEAPLDQKESDYDEDFDASVSSLPSPIETKTQRSTPAPVVPAFCSISVDVRQVFSPISKLCDLNKLRDDLASPIEKSNLMFSEKIASPVLSDECSLVDQVDVRGATPLVIGHPHSTAIVPSVVECSLVDQVDVRGATPLVIELPHSTAIVPSVVAVVAAELKRQDDASVDALKAVERKKSFEEAQQRKHQNLFVNRILLSFKRIDIPKDGHCLFHCFASFFNRHEVSFICSKYFPTHPEGVQFSAKIVRNVCADELIRLEGKIPGLMFVCIIYICIY